MVSANWHKLWCQPIDTCIISTFRGDVFICQILVKSPAVLTCSWMPRSKLPELLCTDYIRNPNFARESSDTIRIRQNVRFWFDDASTLNEEACSSPAKHGSQCT